MEKRSGQLIFSFPQANIVVDICNLYPETVIEFGLGFGNMEIVKNTIPIRPITFQQVKGKTPPVEFSRLLPFSSKEQKGKAVIEEYVPEYGTRYEVGSSSSFPETLSQKKNRIGKERRNYAKELKKLSISEENSENRKKFRIKSEIFVPPFYRNNDKNLYKPQVLSSYGQFLTNNKRKFVKGHKKSVYPNGILPVARRPYSPLINLKNRFMPLRATFPKKGNVWNRLGKSPIKEKSVNRFTANEDFLPDRNTIKNPTFQLSLEEYRPLVDKHIIEKSKDNDLREFLIIAN